MAIAFPKYCASDDWQHSDDDEDEEKPQAFRIVLVTLNSGDQEYYTRQICGGGPGGQGRGRGLTRPAEARLSLTPKAKPGDGSPPGGVNYDLHGFF